MSDTSKYVPLKDPSTGGILVMRYASDQPEELVEPVAGTWSFIYFSSLENNYWFNSSHNYFEQTWTNGAFKWNVAAMGPKVEEEAEPSQQDVPG